MAVTGHRCNNFPVHTSIIFLSYEKSIWGKRWHGPFRGIFPPFEYGSVQKAIENRYHARRPYKDIAMPTSICLLIDQSLDRLPQFAQLMPETVYGHHLLNMRLHSESADIGLQAILVEASRILPSNVKKYVLC